MSWAGKGIHGEGSIDLKYLGHGRLIPIWPFLSTLELHNVKLGSRSVEYLKQLSVHARLRDIIWMENAITGFEMGSKLRQAVCLGLQVVHYELVKYPTSTVAAGPTALNAYKHGDVPQKYSSSHMVWRTRSNSRPGMRRTVHPLHWKTARLFLSSFPKRYQDT